MTYLTVPFAVGDTRRWTAGHGHDPHVVLRISLFNQEVAIKYANKTTCWEPLHYYFPRTEPAT